MLKWTLLAKDLPQELTQSFAKGFFAGEHGDQIGIGMMVHVFTHHVGEAMLAGG